MLLKRKSKNTPSLQTIAINYPMLQQNQESKWMIVFFMPQEFTFDSLPRPKNNSIAIIKHPKEQYIVIRFSGSSSDRNISHHLQKIEKYISYQSIETCGGPLFAFYNPPWTLPFLRRNEIMYLLK